MISSVNIVSTSVINVMIRNYHNLFNKIHRVRSITYLYNQNFAIRLVVSTRGMERIPSVREEAWRRSPAVIAACTSWMQFDHAFLPPIAGGAIALSRVTTRVGKPPRVRDSGAVTTRCIKACPRGCGTPSSTAGRYRSSRTLALFRTRM